MKKNNKIDDNSIEKDNLEEQQLPVETDSNLDAQNIETVSENQANEDVVDDYEESIIRIGKEGSKITKANKFDIFWLKVWVVICAFVNQVSIYINKGIKFVFRKPAPLKYVKAVVASLLVLLMIVILTAPFKITVNKKEELDIYSNGLIVVEQAIGVDSETREPVYKFGYADKNGELVIDCKYNNAMPFKYGVAWVYQVEKVDGMDKEYWMLINKKGKQVGTLSIMATAANPIPVSQFGSEIKYARVNIGSKYGFVDTKGKIVLECKYDDAGNFDYEIARVRLGYDYFFINKKGKSVTDNYSAARDFSEGYAAVSKNGLWSFINEKGKLLFDLQYDQVSDFKQGYALVRSGPTYGIIDASGKVVVKPGSFTDLELRKFFEMN